MAESGETRLMTANLIAELSSLDGTPLRLPKVGRDVSHGVTADFIRRSACHVLVRGDE
jgi:hypothetical protein